VKHSVLPTNRFFRVIYFTTFLLSLLQIQTFQVSPDRMCKDHENGYASPAEQNQKHWKLVFSLSTLVCAEVDVSNLALLTHDPANMQQPTLNSPRRIGSFGSRYPLVSTIHIITSQPDIRIYHINN
jgi:hypothetical protein